jgi:hypothetical protein
MSEFRFKPVACAFSEQVQADYGVLTLISFAGEVIE